MGGEIVQTTWDKLLEYLTPKLNKDDFIKQIVEYGYFAEQFPECFNSKEFANHIDELIPLAPCTKAQAKKVNSNTTQPTTYSTKKDEITRRVLSLPNPKAFIRLVKFMQENWEEIQEYAKSDRSTSKIAYIHHYDVTGQKAMLNSENVRESLRSKSDFIQGLRMAIKTSLGYKYRLKVDIANCYNSLYTHSIAWAICGKERAKQYLRTKQPVTLKDVYEMADNLDTFTRYLKNNETNGIVVGPFTSRIFSEIILSSIDKRLSAKGFTFTRYVDDFKFYFRSEHKAKESLPHIEKILNDYGLQLNSSKTELSKFPYEIMSRMKDDYVHAFNDDGVFGVLNYASQKYSAGEKGAYKYALKYIKDKPPENEYFAEIISTLVNILLLEPKYGKYITTYFKKHLVKKYFSVIKDLINTELEICISDEMEQESLVFLSVLKELNLEVNGQIIIDILSSTNDFAILIALDYWKNNKSKVIRSRTQASEINKLIESLANNLVGETYSGSRWLILYEIERHDLIKKEIWTKPASDDFFNKLYELKVSFYSPFK